MQLSILFCDCFFAAMGNELDHSKYLFFKKNNSLKIEQVMVRFCSNRI